MNVLLSVSLWLALIMSSCCGHETEELTTDHTVTQTSDYDYDYNDHTFDYSSFPEVEIIIPNKGSGIGQLNLVLLLGLVILHAWN